MSESSHLATVCVDGHTASIRSQPSADFTVFSLKAPTGLPGSHWKYARQNGTNETNYLPLCPAEYTNEQSLNDDPVLPTAANTYLFPRSLRTMIRRNGRNLSRDPSDWHLKAVNIGAQIPGSNVLTGEGSAQLVFEVPPADFSQVATHSLHVFYKWSELAGTFIGPAIEQVEQGLR
jgi:hypothetical protein